MVTRILKQRPSSSCKIAIGFPGPFTCCNGGTLLNHPVAQCHETNKKYTDTIPNYQTFIAEGSLEAKLPTVWTDGEVQPGRNPDAEKDRREKIRDGESQKRENAGARKGRKVATHCVFHCFVAPEGQKVGSLKRRVQSQLAR